MLAFLLCYMHLSLLVTYFSPLALTLPKSHNRLWTYFYHLFPDQKSIYYLFKSCLRYSLLLAAVQWWYLWLEHSGYKPQPLQQTVKMAISQADHCSSTITAIFPTAEDTKVLFPVYLLSCSGTIWSKNLSLVLSACWCQWKKVNLLPLFSYLQSDFGNIGICFALYDSLLLGGAALMGNGDKCLCQTHAPICLQLERALQPYLKYFVHCCSTECILLMPSGQHSLSPTWWCLLFVQTLLWMSLCSQCVSHVFASHFLLLGKSLSPTLEL